MAIEQQIFGFNVAIHNLALVQEVNGLNCTRHIELGPILWELFVFFQVRPEFTAETGLLYSEVRYKKVNCMFKQTINKYT